MEESQAGDYYQVSFEKTQDSLIDYLLIQRGFEFEDFAPDRIYIECDDPSLCGHHSIKEVAFTHNIFYLRATNEHEEYSFEINFQIDEYKYRKIKRILEIILFDCSCFSSE